MSAPVRDLTREWRRGDAERLARFFNETGRAWPGGPWDPKTPEEAERQVRETRLLGAFVAEVGDEMAAYCALYAKPTDRNHAYVSLLTAHPDYLGRGFGKAVLLAGLERVHELGLPRLDLHTWPGNMKAVPLYKKSGFMWSPESGPWGVYMQNFTPGARRHPLAQPYFRKHDWYRTMKRDLSLAPDEHKRGKVRAYEYLWEEDGDRLRMVYNRQSWGLVEIETNDLLVGCFLEDEKLVAGLPQRIRWRVVNHRADQPLEVVLIARGDEGVELDHKEIVTVKRRFQAEAEFTVSPEIEEKEREPRAAVIHTDLLINGAPLSLAAGFMPQQALHFALDAGGMGLRPGRPERVVVQVFNEMNRPATAKLRVSAAGARLDRSRVEVRVPARKSAEAPLTLTAPRSGPVRLHVKSEAVVDKRVVRPKAADLYPHVLSPGELVGHMEDDLVVLESAALRLTIHRQGGWAEVTDKVRNRWEIAGIGAPQLGPPFSWEEFFDTRCQAVLEREEGRLTAVLRTESIIHSGLWLERRITLSDLPLIEIRDTLINGMNKPIRGRLRLSVHSNARGGHIVAPTHKGIVRDEHWTFGRSLGDHRLGERKEDWPEGWWASEDRDGVTIGVVWDSAHRAGAWDRGTSLERAFPPAEPGQSTGPGPVYVFVGDGDYTTVRRWWQQIFGPRVDRHQRPPSTRRALEFGFRPRIPVLHQRQREVELVVDAVGRLELDGVLHLSSPDEIRVRPSRLRFHRVCEKNPARRPATITRSSSAKEGAYLMEVTARLDRATYHQRQPVVVIGDSRKRVAVTRTGERGELFVVTNGVLALTVAPAFSGSAVSLKRGVEELLRSAYPQARPLAYENPWFGGICPQLGSVGRGLSRERFKAREIVRTGGQGMVWRGVRVSCSPKQERGRWDTLSLDYLLAPGSSILAIVVRTTRRGGTSGWIGAGFNLWPVLGGSHLEAVLRGSDDERTRRMRNEFGAWLAAEKWIIAENPTAGEAAVMAACDRESTTNGIVFGRDGYFLGANRGAAQEARETRESVFFAAFVEGERAATLAPALSQLEGLP